MTEIQHPDDLDIVSTESKQHISAPAVKLSQR